MIKALQQSTKLSLNCYTFPFLVSKHAKMVVVNQLYDTDTDTEEEDELEILHPPPITINQFKYSRVGECLSVTLEHEHHLRNQLAL